MTVSAQSGRPAEAVDVFLVAGEESGDRLGAALMRALRERTAGQVRFSGVGGREMAAEGVTSLYSIDDLSIIGFSAIPRRIPKILRLMRFTAKAVVARRPHVLVVIDSPGFTRGIARRVRAADPTIPIVEYVSPSVWAWRPGRARVMRAYIDHILALLPFEPEVERLFGVFTETVALIRERVGALDVVVPTIPHLADPIRRATKQWPIPPRI